MAPSCGACCRGNPACLGKPTCLAPSRALRRLSCSEARSMHHVCAALTGHRERLSRPGADLRLIFKRRVAASPDRAFAAGARSETGQQRQCERSSHSGRSGRQPAVSTPTVAAFTTAHIPRLRSALHCHGHPHPRAPCARCARPNQGKSVANVRLGTLV